MRIRGQTIRYRTRRAGLSLLEITIAMAVVMTVMLGAAGAFGSSVRAVSAARKTTRASVFLETVMEDLSAQAYGDLQAFDGNRLYEGANQATSAFAVDLSVTQVAVGLRRVDAIITDLQTGRELGHVASLRAER